MTAPERWIVLEGATNCRDLGTLPAAGGTVRLGQVYRSGALDQLSAADQRTLEALALQAIIDLRLDLEKDRAPNRLSPQLAERQLARPFLPRTTLQLFEQVNSGEVSAATVRALMKEQYTTLVLEHSADFRRLFDDLLAHDGALLVHCTSGKDRTGVFSALLLAALGVSEDDIVDDYVLTNGRIPPITYLDSTIDPEVVALIMAAHPEYIASAFAAMRTEFGGVDTYLRDALGLRAERRERLRERLLE